MSRVLAWRYCAKLLFSDFIESYAGCVGRSLFNTFGASCIPAGVFSSIASAFNATIASRAGRYSFITKGLLPPWTTKDRAKIAAEVPSDHNNNNHQDNIWRHYELPSEAWASFILELCYTFGADLGGAPLETFHERWIPSSSVLMR
jgi:hypothetical protein